MRNMSKGVTPKRLGLVFSLILWLFVCGQIEGPGCGAHEDNYLSLSSSTLEFGNIPVGGSAIKQVVMKNKNDYSVMVTALGLTDDAFQVSLNDQIQPPQLPFVLDGKTERTLYVRFTPQVVKTYRAKLIINSQKIRSENDSQTDNVDLKGVGVQ